MSTAPYNGIYGNYSILPMPIRQKVKAQSA